MSTALLFVMLVAPGLCPELPDGSGLVWRNEQGTDFEVCYAHPPGREYNAAFGIHMGVVSSFTRKPGANDEAGSVGGHALTWQPATGRDGDLPYGEEALFELDRGGAQPPLPVHVWINATTANEQRDARRVLRGVRFRDDSREH